MLIKISCNMDIVVLSLVFEIVSHVSQFAREVAM